MLAVVVAPAAANASTPPPRPALTGLLPGTCLTQTGNDALGDAPIDVESYSLLYNCTYGSWRFDANVAAFDPYTFGTLSLGLDIDRNATDGCDGVDVLIEGTYVTTPDIHPVTKTWRTPNCTTRSLMADGADFGAFDTDLRVMFGQSILGDPSSVTWQASVSSSSPSGADFLPDAGPRAFTGYPTLSDSLWEVNRWGDVREFGPLATHGDLGLRALAAPIVGMARVPDGKGYWLLGRDGGVFSFGSAHFYGSTGGIHLNQPVVGMAATPSGHGYWFVAADGGIFSYGDAHFYGSTGAIRLAKPIVGMAPTPSGHGYWLVASDGGIFAFGDARFYGSTGAIHLNQPIAGMAATPSGHGYWFVAADGGIFGYGDAHYHGSTVPLHLASPIVGMRADHSGNGYSVIAANGAVHPFGDAHSEAADRFTDIELPVVGVG
jgi:hypothetical protein